MTRGQASVSWGDGSNAALSPVGPAAGPATDVPLTASHAFARNGTYQLQVSVTDKDQGTGSSPSQSVTVLYGLNALFAQTGSGRSYKLGSTVPVKLQLLDAYGNASSPSLGVHAMELTQVDTSASATVLAPGSSNPDSDFRYDASLAGYQFNLSTKNLQAGTWKLTFTVDNQADASYAVLFDVR